MSDLVIQTIVFIMRKSVSRSWSCDVEIENRTKFDFASSLNFSSFSFYSFIFLHFFHLSLHDIFLFISTMSCNTKFWTSEACFWHDSTRFWNLHHVVSLTCVKWVIEIFHHEKVSSFSTKKWVIFDLAHWRID